MQQLAAYGSSISASPNELIRGDEKMCTYLSGVGKKNSFVTAIWG